MLAALGIARRPCPARRSSIADGKATVTREVDAGLETIEVDLPAVLTRRPAPQRAALREAAGHHEGEEEAARHARASPTSAWPTAPAFTTVKVEPPPQRQKGVMVKDVAELVAALQEEGVGLMSKILIVAEHDGGKLNASTPSASTCAAKIAGRHDRRRGARRGRRGRRGPGRRDRRRRQGARRSTIRRTRSRSPPCSRRRSRSSPPATRTCSARRRRSART